MLRELEKLKQLLQEKQHEIDELMIKLRSSERKYELDITRVSKREPVHITLSIKESPTEPLA